MRIVAITAIHNERPYLRNFLRHLIANGIDYAVVDNGSTDGGDAVLREPEFAVHLVDYRHVPFTGSFDYQKILAVQADMVRSIDTEWILLVSPDEIMHSRVPGESLSEALGRLAGLGHDVVNFEEFIFLPVERDYVPDHIGMQPLHHYFFFQPRPQRLMRAWKKSLNLSNIESGSHTLAGADFRLAPENLVLRHYIFRSQRHAYEKYAARVFEEHELARGWHRARDRQPVENFTLPPVEWLERLNSPEDRDLSRERPRDRLYWRPPFDWKEG